LRGKKVVVRKVICALDTHDVDEAIRVVKRLSPYVGAFKVGHGLTLPYGLDVLDRLRDAGASRIFLDLKFHDIPNSVALAVGEAARRGVWMMTLHLSGGPAMLAASVAEARAWSEGTGPLLVGVSVLTSLDQHTLTDHLGVSRSIEEHMVYLSRLAMDMDLDGVVCSAHEIKAIRQAIGHGVIVTPGIRLPNGDLHDQKRTGEALQALADGADYLVIGRALTSSDNPEETLEKLGFERVGA
jgi:orotidine-5'-phosphate decarboxylase